MPSDLSIVLLSLRIAGLSMAFVIPVGIITAWLLARKRFPGRFLLEAMTTLPLALPPVLVGFVLLWAVGGNSRPGKIINGLFNAEIAFTWVAASLAAAIVAFPLSVRAFTAAIAGVDPRLETAARGLGAGTVRVFFTITMPLAYRGIFAGMLLGFVRAFSEFGATIVVAGNIPGRTQTVPSAIFTRISTGDDTAVWRLAIVSVVIAVIALAAHNYLLRRNDTGTGNHQVSK
jgi:molybdate transport system permease protein